MTANNKKSVAIVTGTSSGIGLGITQALLKKGFSVVANSRTISKSHELKPSSDLILVEGDITKKETAFKVVDAAVKAFGLVDLLVNNAGILYCQNLSQTIRPRILKRCSARISEDTFSSLKLRYCKCESRSGHVVGISTVLVDQPLAGASISLPVIKSTVPAFSRALAMRCIADGIRFNTISPGVVNTPMHEKDDLKSLEQLQPNHKIVQISDIVDALLYLQSASMVNGENIRVDGGAHAGTKW